MPLPTNFKDTLSALFGDEHSTERDALYNLLDSQQRTIDSQAQTIRSLQEHNARQLGSEPERDEGENQLTFEKLFNEKGELI